MKTAVLFLILSVCLLGCSQLRVYDDYDRDADFAAYQTYRWIERDKAEGVIPLYDKRIRMRVDEELVSKGFREVDADDVDLIVSYEAVMKERIQMRAADYYWPGYYPEVDRYQQGTLLIDLIDPAKNQLVWRGTATGVFDEDPKQADQQLAKSIKKIMKRYPPKK